MTEEDYVDRTTSDIKVLFDNDLRTSLISAIMSEGYAPSARELISRLDGSHEDPTDLSLMNERQLHALFHCLKILSYRDAIGDWVVGPAIRRVITTVPFSDANY